MNAPQISRLFYYPIKSFRGIEAHRLNLTAQGSNLDRQWMLVDEKGQFLTQRQMPQLATIGVAVLDDARIELTKKGELITDFGLLEKEGAQMTVKVWKDEVPAFEVSESVSKDISDAIGKMVKLVRMSDECHRPGKFSDDAPLLVISEASLKGLEDRAKSSLSMARFRPNVVIRYAAAHAEDEWPEFKLGSVTFRRKKPCTRCRITQVHPLTGEVGAEPLQTLMTYRKLEKGIAFGQYYVNDRLDEIHVGQALSFN